MKKEWKGTEKQIKYAADLMTAINKNIDRKVDEMIQDRMKAPRRIERRFGNEENMKKVYKESANLLKECYERRAFQYMDGNASVFLNHRYMFKVGYPVSNISNIREHIISLVSEIISGEITDSFQIRKSIEDYKNGKKYQNN